MIQKLTDDTFTPTISATEKPVLVDFSAPWCGPCRIQRPVLQSFADAHPEVEVVELDIQDSPKVANALRIQSVPTLVLFRGGEPVVRARGLQTASKLEAMLRSAP